MRIQFLQSWNMPEAMDDIGSVINSTRTTWILSIMIIASLFSVICIKYHNHRLYNNIKDIEHKTHAMYRERQVVTSQKVQLLGFESIENFLSKAVSKDAIKV